MARIRKRRGKWVLDYRDQQGRATALASGPVVPQWYPKRSIMVAPLEPYV